MRQMLSNRFENPLKPTNYSAALFSMPIEWIRKWWRNRPLSLAFRLRDRLLEIRKYQNLLKDTIGLEITDNESKQFQGYYDQLISSWRIEERY